MVNYQPKSNYVLSQDILPYLSISSAILNYQPKNNYFLSQDVLAYSSISSAILNYQSKFNLNDYLTVNNASIRIQMISSSAILNYHYQVYYILIKIISWIHL